MYRESSLQISNRFALGGLPQAVEMNYRRTGTESGGRDERPGWSLLASRLTQQVESSQLEIARVQSNAEAILQSTLIAVERLEKRIQSLESLIGAIEKEMASRPWPKLKAWIARTWRNLTHRRSE